MKKLIDKLDARPQSFDKEALWESIEKPQRRKRSIWVYCIAMFGIALLVLLLTIPHYKNGVYTQDRSESTTKLTSMAHSLSIPQPIIGTTLQASPGKSISGQSIQVDSIDTNKYITTIATNKNASSLNTNQYKSNLYKQRDVRTDKNTFPSPNPEDFGARMQNTTNSDSLYQHTDRMSFYKDVATVSPLPLRKAMIMLSSTMLDKISVPILIVKSPSTKTNSINISAGIIRHKSFIASPEAIASKYRDSLETPQLGYHIAIEYDRVMFPKLYVTLGMSYSLIKENIRHSVIENTSLRHARIHYNLYNHYHNISTKLGLGSFISIGIGRLDYSIGAKYDFWQHLDLDYFNAENTLASATDIKEMYDASPALYAYGAVSYSYKLSDAHMVGINIEYNTKNKLTKRDASISHYIQKCIFSIALKRSF